MSDETQPVVEAPSHDIKPGDVVLVKRPMKVAAVGGSNLHVMETDYSISGYNVLAADVEKVESKA